MTGFDLSELVVFRPQRLALHELLIRVTADFAVPDGSQIGDLGINFRRIAGQILAHYLVPDMELITRGVRAGPLRDGGCRRGRARRRRARTRTGRGTPAAAGAPAVRLAAGRAAVRRLRSASAAGDPPKLPSANAGRERRPRSCRSSRTTRWLESCRHCFTAHGHAWGTRTLIGQLAKDLACNTYGSDAVGRTIEPMLAARGTAGGLRSVAVPGTTDRHQYQGSVRIRQEHAAAAAEEARGRARHALRRFRVDQPRHLAQAAARLRVARCGLQICGRVHRG